MRSEQAVVVDRLERIYSSRRESEKVTALADVTLTVERGEIHGLLGPNGAGKTTLVKILSTLLVPTFGSAAVLGLDVVSRARQIRQKTGVVFGGERGLYTRVSARQNLMFWAALYHLDGRDARRRSQLLLERVGLGEHSDMPVEEYSRGMKQRLHLARGLLHDPEVLFLDEPTTGMDPLAAHGFRDLVRELQAEGRTILLTTHDMAEAEALCGRVSLIDQGRLMLSEPTTEVGRYLTVRECVDFSCDDTELLAGLRALPFVKDVQNTESGSAGCRAFPATAADTGAVLLWLIERGVLSARRAEPTLEEVYLRLVGERGMKI